MARENTCRRSKVLLVTNITFSESLLTAGARVSQVLGGRSPARGSSGLAFKMNQVFFYDGVLISVDPFDAVMYMNN